MKSIIRSCNVQRRVCKAKSLQDSLKRTRIYLLNCVSLYTLLTLQNGAFELLIYSNTAYSIYSKCGTYMVYKDYISDVRRYMQSACSARLIIGAPTVHLLSMVRPSRAMHYALISQYPVL